MFENLTSTVIFHVFTKKTLRRTVPLEKLTVTQLVKKSSRLLWNPTIHNRENKTPPLFPILSQAHPVHTFPPYFPKIVSNSLAIYF